MLSESNEKRNAHQTLDSDISSNIQPNQKPQVAWGSTLKDLHKPPNNLINEGIRILTSWWWQCLIRALPSVKGQNRCNLLMWKVIAMNALAQNHARCKNLQNSMEVQAYDSWNSTSFCPWFCKTVVCQGLGSVDQSRIIKNDEEFMENWWKMCGRSFENLREFGGKFC